MKHLSSTRTFLLLALTFFFIERSSHGLTCYKCFTNSKNVSLRSCGLGFQERCEDFVKECYTMTRGCIMSKGCLKNFAIKNICEFYEDKDGIDCKICNEDFCNGGREGVECANRTIT